MTKDIPKPLLSSNRAARPVPASFSDPLAAPRPAAAAARPARNLYTVERVYPRVSQVLVGQGGLDPDRVSSVLNARGAEGWELVTTTVTTARMWLFWRREAALLTFVRSA